MNLSPIPQGVRNSTFTEILLNLLAIESHPFEVTETGWGEFQLQIRIQFHDPNQKALNLTHHLKLYPTDDVENLLKTTKPVISEHYEEIVFDPPSDIMRTILETSDKDSGSISSTQMIECSAFLY